MSDPHASPSPPRRPTPRTLAIALTPLLAFAVYAPTMSRGIGTVDQGELAAVATTLGIAHPTGYPLLTMMAHVWQRLVPLRPILALDLFVAALTALSAGALTACYEHVLTRWVPPPPPRPARLGRGRAPAPAATPVLGDGARALAAGAAALATVWTGTWWDQATGFEVYALHTLMLALVTLTFLRWLSGEGSGRVFGYTLGLAFSNHLTTVLLAPGFLLLWGLERGLGRRALSGVVSLVPWFALGLTPYLYLPLRSLNAPRFDWGAPHTLARFLSHVGGWQFRVWMFTEPDTFRLQTAYFFGRLPHELAWIGVALALLGLAIVFARAPRLGWALVLVFAATLVYAGGFAIAEIRPYYLAAVLVTGVTLATALAWIGERFGARVLIATGVALALAIAAVNWRASDAHDEHAVEDMTHDVLDPLPRDAVVLSTQWDYWLAGSFYLQTVERLRPDVTVIDLESLRRSWYLDELARRAPWLAARVREPFARFQREVAPFEAQRPYDGTTIEQAYEDMIAAIEREAATDRPVFVTSEIGPGSTTGWQRVPYGLVQLLSHRGDYLPGPAMTRWRQRVDWSHPDAYAFVTAELYARGAADRAVYEAAFGRDSLALAALALARGFTPQVALADVPSLPYHGRDQVTRTLAFFDQLRALDLDALRRAARPAPPADR